MIVPAMSNVKLSYNHRWYNIITIQKLNFVIQGALDKCHENSKKLLYNETDIASLRAWILWRVCVHHYWNIKWNSNDSLRIDVGI